MKQASIQRDLNRRIMLASLTVLLLAGALSATISFFEARELQDNMLREIASLVNNHQLSDNFSRRDEKVEEETITVHFLSHLPGLDGGKSAESLADGLQTISIDGEKWRVLVLTKADSGTRLAIGQQTELRDNIALASSLNVILPILLLTIIMLLVINYIIASRLRPLKTLTDNLNQLEATRLRELPEVDIPEEIAPFVKSINALIVRTQSAMNKQHRFIADAAHELRTPITALSLLAENLERADSVAEREQRLSLLNQGLDRLRVLVVQLLDLARLQSDSSGLTETVSFNQVVRDAIADLYPLSEAAQIDLGMKRQEALRVKDEDGRLGQLVRNAIENAIRYSPAESRVDISLYSEKELAIFCVEDPGAGIPEAEIEQVMQPFYRTLQTNQAGNGLGLAISQEIAERLNGKISISNREAGGLCFRYEQERISGDDAFLHGANNPGIPKRQEKSSKQS